MEDFQSEVTYFRYCRKIDGSLEPVDVAKRNNRLVPRFHPSVIEPELPADPEQSTEYRELVEEVSQNLNAIERRTWLRLLDGRSILDIAVEDGVSRAAIYERIRGNSRGHAGMIAKNGYVAIWWRLKNKTNQHS
jgi:hypothetical protein